MTTTAPGSIPATLTLVRRTLNDRGESRCSPANQALRRETLLALHRERSRLLFRPDGTWHRDDQPLDARAWCWNALAFIGGDEGDVRLAHQMLHRSLNAAYPGGFSHFWCSAVTSLLVRHAAKLDSTLRGRLLEQLASKLKRSAAQRFRGYNDNFPAMAALTVLVGGRLTGRREFDDQGLECLRSLKRLLARRGLLSEYTSPTYTPITLGCLAEIAEWCDLDEARTIARVAEGRIWLDLGARYFPPTSTLAGPHSRAYAADLCGHFLKAHTLFWLVFGDEVAINPLNTAYSDPRDRVLHEGRPDFVQKSIPWTATPTYHVPETAIRLALDKPRECEVYADAEQAAFQRHVWEPRRHPVTPLAEFAAGEMHTYTFMTRRYAIGHADRTFLDGFQHSPLHLSYAREAKPRSVHDVVTLFPRFLIGDRLPDPLQHHLYDDGRALCVGSRGTAMALYRARPHWGANNASPQWSLTPVTKLRLAVLLTCFTSEPDELWIGERPLSGLSGESETPSSIFIADGDVFIALHPLIQTNLGRRVALRVEKVNGFAMISLFNYEGAARTFDDGELATCLNGVILDVSTRQDWPGEDAFGRFRRSRSAASIRDEYFPDDAMRFAEYRRPDLSLSMEVSPVSDGIKCALVNERPVPKHPFMATGLDPATIPWLEWTALER